MKKFIIEITETLQRQIEVEAESKDTAMSTIRNQYSKQEIVLDSSDYINTNFEHLANL